MADISFYHLERQPMTIALPRLLEKVLAAGHRALVCVGSDARAAELDEALWSYDPASFLPHGRADDGDPDLQPILISTKAEALNGADILVVADAALPPDMGGYERCLYMFDGHDADITAKARDHWKAFKDQGHALTYWQQTPAGGWEKKA